MACFVARTDEAAASVDDGRRFGEVQRNFAKACFGTMSKWKSEAISGRARQDKKSIHGDFYCKKLARP